MHNSGLSIGLCFAKRDVLPNVDVTGSLPSLSRHAKTTFMIWVAGGPRSSTPRERYILPRRLKVHLRAPHLSRHWSRGHGLAGLKQAARQWSDDVGGAGLTPYVESHCGIGLCIVTNITVHRELVLYIVYTIEKSSDC